MESRYSIVGPETEDEIAARDDDKWLLALANIQQALGSKDLFEKHIQQASSLGEYLPTEGVVLHSCTSEQVLRKYKVGPLARIFLNEPSGYLLLDPDATRRFFNYTHSNFPTAMGNGKLSYIAEKGTKWVICQVSDLLRGSEYRTFNNV